MALWKDGVNQILPVTFFNQTINANGEIFSNPFPLMRHYQHLLSLAG